MSWGRTTQADGLVTAMTEPVTTPEVTRVFDPAAPWVLLGSPPSTDPARGFDVPFTTEEFFELATEMRTDVHAGGLVARQLRIRPPDVLRFSRGPDPAARYRAFGLVVGVVLLYPLGNAQLTTLDDAEMDAALARLEGVRS